MSVTLAMPIPYIAHYEQGVSASAKQLAESVAGIRDHAAQTISFGWRDTVSDRLVEFQTRYGEVGWDGGDALPIGLHAVLESRIFVELLPDGLSTPDVLPESSGEIGFEWRSGSDIVFSVSVNPDSLVYAGLLGSEKSHGETKFLNEVPKKISDILSEYFLKS